MNEILKMERHEFMYGPHFNEKCALKAVSNMKNCDGTIGAHWDIEETTEVASQYGVSFKDTSYNKYDWYVALNMVYSDYYRAVTSINGSDKCYIELAKDWLNDPDVSEGKMWYYYKFVVCEKVRKEIFCDDYDEDIDDDIEERHYPSTQKYSDTTTKYIYHKPMYERISRY